jgi:hypothetical protein
MLIHTRSATNQLSPHYIHDKSAERKATCFLNMCLYSNEYMPIENNHRSGRPRLTDKRTNCDISNNVCWYLQNWCYCLNVEVIMFLTSDWLIFFRMRVTNWPNIFVNLGQFIDPDFISSTHQREHVQFADKNTVADRSIV